MLFHDAGAAPDIPGSRGILKMESTALVFLAIIRHDGRNREQCSPKLRGANMSETRYLQPDWFTRNVFNRVVRGLGRLGISLAGSRELRVRGRKSGEWRSTPVNPLVVDGQRYLVAPRGTTQWVRNIRVTKEGELRRGRRVERFQAVEVSDDAKVPVLRSYLDNWAWEAGKFFGVGKDASDADLARIAAGFPVFQVIPL
jgi:deazaflavin-dependent oxidoreductase (nitroreductase family)